MTDIFGNREEIVVQVQIKEAQTQVAEKLEPLNPSKGRNFVNPNTVAVAIGIENMKKLLVHLPNLDANILLNMLKKLLDRKTLLL